MVFSQRSFWVTHRTNKSCARFHLFGVSRIIDWYGYQNASVRVLGVRRPESHRGGAGALTMIQADSFPSVENGSGLAKGSSWSIAYTPIDLLRSVAGAPDD